MEFLSPGHYKSESPPQTMTIAGQSVSTGAVLGVFERGPIGQPRLITSLSEFRRVFGGYIPESYAAHAIEGALRNKPGMRIWVTRTAHYSDPADASTCEAAVGKILVKDRASASPTETVEFAAADPGKWAEKVTVEVGTSSRDAENTFRIIVKYNGNAVEAFDGLSMDTASENYVESRINGKSNYIRVTDQKSITAAPNNMPAEGTYKLTGGADGIEGITDADYIGSSAAGTGLHSFDTVEDALLLIVPGIATSAVHNAMLEYAATRTDVFAILDPPMGATYQDIKNYVEQEAQLNSEYGAIYWPNVMVTHPATGRAVVVPPSGHIMGAYARVDSAPGKGPWQVAAGVEHGQLYGVLAVEDNAVNNKTVRDVIYPARINPIRSMARYGRVLYGARTLSGTGKMVHINERRTFQYVQKTVDTETQWVEFENNEPRLWNRLNRTISAFLLRTWRGGGLRGNTPEEAFIVKIDEELNPEPSSTLQGRIGIATHVPTEFVWMDYQKHTLEAAGGEQ